MIKKQFVKSRNVTKVTFELPADLSANSVHLLADFNSWEPVPFDQLKNGKWKLIQEVEPGHSYQFRYMLAQGDGYDFINDDDADGTVPNDKGTENAIINA